jgi:UDP-N-acetylmuramoyl-L-alanyl-D-glutamate--2,6-diaminopimelate ligase
LIEKSGVEQVGVAGGDPELLALSADSREVKEGFLFAALAGARRDGCRFAGEAVAKGAVAILTDRPEALSLSPEERARVSILCDPNPRRRFALFAARFYGRQPRTIAAVTGTNGKTSVVDFTRQIWTALGFAAASLGTLGLVTPKGRRPGSLTSPDPVALHRDLAALAEEGIEHLAIEASSHGLDQFRLDGLRVAAAAFTNLSRDHLDYHGHMGRYRAAKERLFSALLEPRGTAVLNADSDAFGALSSLCREHGHPVLAYGRAESAGLRLLAAQPGPQGERLRLDILGERRLLAVPLFGEFQAQNALAALGLAIAAGAPAQAAAAALAHLKGVPGRMQRVSSREDGPLVIVDYAHTPDALAAALKALRPYARGRLVTLFGCGGDRDQGKRVLMGRIAADLADRVYVTDDNPRREPAAGIRRAIIEGAPAAIEIGDRRQAMVTAMAELRPEDALLVAGKGHETSQIIGEEAHPFDDAAVVREILGR